MQLLDKTLLFIYINSIFVDCSTNHTIIHLNKTIEYRITTIKENLDLTISYNLPSENCSHPILTLVDFISLYSSTTRILPENVTTLKLINSCVYIDIKTIQKLLSIRRLIFEYCTIYFTASQQREDYDFYPKNLSRWLFHRGQTDTFDQFITMINHLDPFKFDLQLSGCFKPILSFNDFIPLDTQLIFLNITCQHFQIDEPFDIKTRTAIFLTPTLIINTQSSPCPLKNKYQWLNLKRSNTKIVSLRTLTCEDRLIQLNADPNQIIIGNTTMIGITTQTSFSQSTNFNKWTAPILINFTIILLSMVMLCIALTIFLIRFCRK